MPSERCGAPLTRVQGALCRCALLHAPALTSAQYASPADAPRAGLAAFDELDQIEARYNRGELLAFGPEQEKLVVDLAGIRTAQCVARRRGRRWR